MIGKSAQVSLVFVALAVAAVNMGFAASGEQPVVLTKGVIDADTLWQGPRQIAETVAIPAGARLRIVGPAEIEFQGAQAAIQVAGKLEIVGTAEFPVILRGVRDGKTDWGGIQLSGADAVAVVSHAVIRGASGGMQIDGARSEIDHARFENCFRGITVTGKAVLRARGVVFDRCQNGIAADRDARLELNDSEFVENGKGVELSSGASADIRDSSFLRGKLGLGINQGVEVLLTGSTFSGVAIGVELYQVGPRVRIEANRFENGAVGVLMTNYSSPVIRCNTFRAMETAVLAQRFCAPEIRHNTFTGNKIAVATGFKTNGAIGENIFAADEQSIFVDFSSYPSVTGNNFLDNGKDLVLGKNMSADWEQRVGSDKTSQARAVESGSRHLDRVGVSLKPDVTFNARNNWWGPKATEAMEKSGGTGVVNGIVDYHHLGDVVYAGSGDKKFRIDTVVYQPWEKTAFQDIGAASSACRSPDGDREKLPE